MRSSTWFLLYTAIGRWSILISGLTAKSAPLRAVNYRYGSDEDTIPIALQLIRELMNPLGIRTDRFLIAYTKDQPRIGWAQIRPLPGFDDQVQREVDDIMWEDFERNDNIKVPVGLESLPWTDEYRVFAQQVESQGSKRQAELELTRDETVRNYELASVWVDPAFRGQGIGTELLRRLLQRHCQLCGPVSNVYLLTLASTSKWYRENFGFKLVPLEDIPQSMTFEVSVGKVVTGVIGSELICMQGTSIS